MSVNSMQSTAQNRLLPPRASRRQHNDLLSPDVSPRRFTPGGERLSDDNSDINESSPMRVSSTRLVGPAMTDDNDNWDFPHPETLASTLIYGDTVKNNLIERNPHFSEDSLTMPIPGGRVQKTCVPEGSAAIVVNNRITAQVPTNPTDDETALLLSSASLVSDECEKLEPVTAKVQYHRRKRLEWRLDNSQPKSMERKSNADGNSWTVYDDLLEELEGTIETSTHKREWSESLHCLGLPTSTEMSAIIEKYLKQKFMEFTTNRSETSNKKGSSLPIKACADIGIMTEPDEKDEDEPSLPKIARCLPVCKCVPAKTVKRRG